MWWWHLSLAAILLHLPLLRCRSPRRDEEWQILPVKSSKYTITRLQKKTTQNAHYSLANHRDTFLNGHNDVAIHCSPDADEHSLA